MKRKGGQKILSERETQNHLSDIAKANGFFEDYRRIIDRYENLLKKCSNEKERQQIAIMGNVEVHRLFGFRNALVVRKDLSDPGEEIIPTSDDEGKVIKV